MRSQRKRVGLVQLPAIAPQLTCRRISAHPPHAQHIHERPARTHRPRLQGRLFDSKLEKNGHPELLAADVDWDSSASMEKRERRKKGKSGGQGAAHAVQPLSTTDA